VSAVRELNPEPGEPVDRLRRWRDLEALGLPLIVLIGGTTGVGKSTVATEVAARLGITRVSSTDFIRQILRSVVAEAIAPELSRSSFELDQGSGRDGARSYSEFERQAHEVLVGVRATIDRAVAEGTSIILEGIHLLPGLIDRTSERHALVVPVVLVVEGEDEHEDRFALRAQTSQRPAQRYDDGLAAIRALQRHLVDCARRDGVPVIANRDEHATVRCVLDVVMNAVDDALRRR
jgi:2-phosphoglycerate kinase